MSIEFRKSNAESIIITFELTFFDYLSRKVPNPINIPCMHCKII